MTGRMFSSNLLRRFAPGLLALPLAFAPAAMAHDDAGDHARAEKQIGRHVGKMKKELKLTDEQATRIKAILAENHGEDGFGPWGHGGWRGMHGKHGRMCDRHGAGPMGHAGDLAKQLRAGSVDTAALNRAAAERLEALRARHARATATFAEIHAVLTPEQRAKAAERMEKRLEKMRKKCED